MSGLGKGTERVQRELKHLRQRVTSTQPAEHSLLHIVGCQRSGTTMLTELLDRDARVRVYGELGRLFDERPRHHRLRDDEEVRRQLGRSGASLNVVKPLVESHRVRELLALQPDAIAIWMFRHYRDVAASNLRRFGVDNGVNNLRPIVDDIRDWRNAGLTDATREVVRSLFREGMPPHDAAALFWYCRNTLWANQQLATDDRIMTLQYEQLVSDPGATIRPLYRWVGFEPPRQGVTDFVHARSIGRGRVEIGEKVRTLCDTMWDDLVTVDRSRSVLAAP